MGDTDIGRELKEKIKDLEKLLEAYYTGTIAEKFKMCIRDSFGVIEFQKKRLGTTRGFVAVKPNCSIQSYAPVLTAWKEFEPYEVVEMCIRDSCQHR